MFSGLSWPSLVEYLESARKQVDWKDEESDRDVIEMLFMSSMYSVRSDTFGGPQRKEGSNVM